MGLCDRGVGVQFQVGGQEIFLFSITPRPALGPCKISTAGCFARVKRQVREADHSSPSNAEVKNDGAIPPLPIGPYDMVLK
jgi:hypothetical protein